MVYAVVVVSAISGTHCKNKLGGLHGYEDTEFYIT